jgi:hypothetical protein
MSPTESSALSAGAHFIRCALQVNPFAYLERHIKHTTFGNEASYNDAIVNACLANEIDAIGITDHYRVKTSQSLARAARDAGIVVFPGFEAVTKDGVHMLCLFDPGTSGDEIDRRIGQCGIVEGEEESPIGDLDARDLLAASTDDWKAICIAAHVAGPGGLLKVLSGQSRAKAWKDPNLRACCLPGPVSDAPESVRPIIRNTNPQYRRERSIAVINAKDVCDPAELSRPGVSTLIKMTQPTRFGLRQAFLDPESRIRLDSDPALEAHAEFTQISWTGGFLDGVQLSLNKNLNVFVGGRGTGKSTVIESFRTVLGLTPTGADAAASHRELVKRVLGNGTQISLGVSVSSPSRRRYVIQRLLPNDPVVRDEAGTQLDLTPADLVANAEVYGQHEISEIAQDPEQRTVLLRRFLDRTADEHQSAELRLGLRDSGRGVLEALDRTSDLRERLAALPALEETRKRFKESGIEEKLKTKSLVVEEEQVLEDVRSEIERVEALADNLREGLPIEKDIVAQDALKDLPNRATLRRLNKILSDLERQVDGAVDLVETAMHTAAAALEEVEDKWLGRSEVVDKEYAKILRELQRESIDGEELIKLRRQIARLRPLKQQLSKATAQLQRATRSRRRAVSTLDSVRASRFRELERAAKRVNRQLKGRVRVTVTFQGARDRLVDLLKGEVGGRLKESCDILADKEDLSVSALGAACREGQPDLVDRYELPESQAERLADAGEAVFQKIEELDLPSTTQLELNVARTGAAEEWRALEALSAGQKATAVLLLLLLESDAPLVIDQPEDDLDNRFITEEVVPRMRQEKRRRQFLFSTHNANIPVLGDAELIVGLEASGDAMEGQVDVPPENLGSIDVPTVCELVERLLEGGKEAFELRRLKYGPT